MSHRHLLHQLTCLGLAALFLTSCAGTRGDAGENGSQRILFIGNSYTHVNNLPQMFAELAQSGGHTVQVDMVAKGGWTLAKHAASGQVFAKIQEQDWDYVVLQEQSVIPSKQNVRKRSMIPAARTLDARIQQAGAKTVLFMTWGRRDGLAQEGFADFYSMQAQLQAGYNEVGQELDAVVAPVGMAWQNAIAQQPQLALWDQDGSHPHKNGSYLAACVFYALLIQETPQGLAYNAGLSKETAQFLQRIAAETVIIEH